MSLKTIVVQNSWNKVDNNDDTSLSNIQTEHASEIASILSAQGVEDPDRVTIVTVITEDYIVNQGNGDGQ